MAAANAPPSRGATNTAASDQFSRNVGMSPSTRAQPEAAASRIDNPNGSYNAGNAYIAARAHQRAIAAESSRPRQVTLDKAPPYGPRPPQSPARTPRHFNSGAISARAARFFASSQRRPAPSTTSDLSG